MPSVCGGELEAKRIFSGGVISNEGKQRTWKWPLMKWGNSAAVRIPAAVFKAAGFSLGQTVEVRAENGRVGSNDAVTDH